MTDEKHNCIPAGKSECWTAVRDGDDPGIAVSSFAAATDNAGPVGASEEGKTKASVSSSSVGATLTSSAGPHPSADPHPNIASSAHGLHIRGRVIDGFGETVGGGLVISDNGILLSIDPVEDAFEGRYIVPGFVDVHCHGGGGESFTDSPTLEGVAQAINTHRMRGTTAQIASLVSLVDPLPVIQVLVDFCERGELAGIHLEGPFVSKEKCGAQNPAAIRDPELDKLEEWLKAGRGWITTMTIAPELPRAYGENSAAHMLLDYGARPSWGHTSGSGEATAAAIVDTSRYAQSIGFSGIPQTATHLFNAMPTLTHRSPGPVRELLRAAANGHCVVELIGDGVHVDKSLVADLVEMLDPHLGVALITDALAGAGMPDGDYKMGGLAVEIRGGVAHLAGSQTIAGSTARLGEEIRVLKDTGLLTLEQIIRAMVAAPVKALGLEGRRGVSTRFEIGAPVNAVLLNDTLDVLKVVREGVILES